MKVDDYHLSDRRLLAAADRWLGSVLDWQPLSGAVTGSTNRIYRAPAEALILRVSGDLRATDGVDRQREAAVLNRIQGYDWAPRVLQNNWQQGWCLMADHGEALGAHANSDALSGLLAAIAEWQQIDPVSLQAGPFDYPRLFEGYRNALTKGSDQRAIALVRYLETIFASLPQVSACLTHHDLHWGNLCAPQTSSLVVKAPAERAKSTLTVLDWEYAAIANPWFDAAALYSSFDVDAQTLSALPAWHRLSQAQFNQGLAAACWLKEALDWLWYQQRTERGLQQASADVELQRLLAEAEQC